MCGVAHFETHPFLGFELCNCRFIGRASSSPQQMFWRVCWRITKNMEWIGHKPQIPDVCKA